MRIFKLIVALSLIAIPLAAQPNDVAGCQFAGTWYGGSGPDAPYLLTVEPAHGGRYGVTFQWAGSSTIAATFGYERWTTWSGEAVKTAPGEYEVTIISYWMFIHEFAVANGIDDSKPELDMGHAIVRFVDCDRVDVEIDMFAGFIAFDPAVRTPFVGPYDWELPEGETLLETYQRMPRATSPTTARSEVRLDSFKTAAPSQLRWRRR